MSLVLQTLNSTFSFFFFVTPPWARCDKQSMGLHKTVNSCTVPRCSVTKHISLDKRCNLFSVSQY